MKTMTAMEQITELEKRTVDGCGFILTDGLKVRVRVLDSRKAFGRDDVLVTPTDGSGQRWMDIKGLTREG
jgi:hypothetical protein